MARQEHDREDLLAEAVALVERIELRVGDWPQSVTAGFRRDGSASFYLTADEVYQFNTARQLRRAFLAGRLIKARHGLRGFRVRSAPAILVASVYCIHR